MSRLARRRVRRPVRPDGEVVVVHLTTTDMSLDWLLGPQLRAFGDAGYRIVGMSASGSHVAAIEAAGVRHVAVDALTRAPSVAQDLRASRQLVRLLRVERPDILHTHNPKPGIIGRVIGRALRVPVVVNTQHGMYAQPTDRRRRRWPVYIAERCAAACSDAELVQNPEDARTLTDRLHVPAARVHVLGNGVDLRRFDPATISAGERSRLRALWGFGDDDVVAAVVGRLVREKGLVELFEAAAVLRSEGSRVRFVVIGPADTDKPDAVDRDLVERARRDGVVFAGRHDDMAECYSACDLFVTASHREGFPRAAMEAGAMALPIVATDIRGCRQVVADGVNGVLVEVRSAVSLAAGIRRVVDDDAFRGTLTSAARRHALAHFDQQRVIDITLSTYARLLGERRLRDARRS